MSNDKWKMVRPAPVAIQFAFNNLGGYLYTRSLSPEQPAPER
jgi:hypothetical protein